MALTDSQVKSAKTEDKQYKLADDKGLYLLVHGNGSKYWRMNYRYAGKQKTLALGIYPDTSLAQARKKRDEAKQHIQNDIDPSDLKRSRKLAKHQQAENSFSAIALEWYEKEKPHWSESHTKRVTRLIKKDLIPALGTQPVGTITPPDLLACLRRIESRGAINTAHRVKQTAGMIFRYAVAIGKADRDPSADLKQALATPKKTHFAAITEPKKVGPFLLTIDSYEGTPEVEAALRIHPYLFVRTIHLRHMEWSEIDWDKALWSTPANKMKMAAAHITPLSRQAIAILKTLQAISSDSRYVFPSARTKTRAMSDNAMLAAIRRMGISKEEMTPHGYRAMARTLLDEQLGFNVDWIESQLAHSVKDANGRAYNRTQYLEQRTAMMQRWADYLDSLKADAMNTNVIAGSFKQA